MEISVSGFEYDVDCDKISFADPAWMEIALIVSVQAATIFLSLSGVLSSGFVVASIGTVCLLGVNILLGAFLKTVLKREPDPDSEYLEKLKQLNPSTIAVVLPFGEEVLFRAGLQRGLQSVLSRCMTPANLTVLGVPFTTAALATIVIAGTVFGLMHCYNGHNNADIQGITATIGGLFLGTIYYQYGFLASLFAHSINNTFAAILLTADKNAKQGEDAI